MRRDAPRTAPQASAGAPVNLDEALRAACGGVAGITPAQFRALLSPEDTADLEAGAIHPKTLHAYALIEALELVGAWGFIYTTFGFTWIGRPSKTRSATDPVSKPTLEGEA